LIKSARDEASLVKDRWLRLTQTGHGEEAKETIELGCSYRSSGLLKLGFGNEINITIAIAARRRSTLERQPQRLGRARRRDLTRSVADGGDSLQVT
jgi:hypothetical protein